MGISTEQCSDEELAWIVSQSLSGWDGDFHSAAGFESRPRARCRNPFQGGMGISTSAPGDYVVRLKIVVAIPFRVGWGFPRDSGGP